MGGHAGVVILEGAVLKGSCRRGQTGGPYIGQAMQEGSY